MRQTLNESFVHRKKIIIIATVFIVAAVVFYVWYIANQANAIVDIGQQEVPLSSSVQMVVDDGAIEWSGELQSLSAETEEESIKVPYYTDLRYNSQTDILKVTLPNPQENDCYISYTFKIVEEGVELGATNLIEPGMAVEQVEIANSIEAGEYNLEIRVAAYSLDDMSPLNNAVINTKLIVS